jgi:hypothetical protein
MAQENRNKGPQKRRIKNLIFVMIVLVMIAGIPFFLLNYQSQHTGMSRSEVINGLFNRTKKIDTVSGLIAENSVGEKISFLDSRPIGKTFTKPPQITNITVADLDNDGLPDVVICDARSNFISWIRQYPKGTYTESVLAEDLIAPAHVQVTDFDKDGDKDIMVAVLGMLFPNNDKIGSVVILENDGRCNFRKQIVADKIARVSDVRAGDLDNDGDMDMAVAQFGYDDGETRWIENLGNWKFKSHILQNISGPINVEIVDIDKDGDLDIISVVSQEWEELYCFLNDVKGNFQSRLIYKSSNEDYGSSGISICDFDKDGDDDILYTNGDAFDYIPPLPRPWHGVQWLENKGNMNFEFHRICNYAGAYAARSTDIDHDGDLDLFVVSGFNLWEKPESQSLIWLENTGNMQFKKHDLANTPTHLLTLELGDFNNDGLMDMVTGGMHTYPPNDRLGRVTLWKNNGLLSVKK